MCQGEPILFYDSLCVGCRKAANTGVLEKIMLDRFLTVTEHMAYCVCFWFPTTRQIQYGRLTSLWLLHLCLRNL